MDFENCKKEFERYVNSFDRNNEKIARKYIHSLRVAEYAEQISKSEDLENHDILIAKVSALLHDIARFRQAKEFNTFNDFQSFDHGDVGCEILIENDYISNFLMNEEDKRICLKAVKNHNKYRVEENLSERELYFVNLVRDSDKIDLLDTQKNEISDGKADINSQIMDALLHHRLYQKKPFDEENQSSAIVRQLCFLFDLNFKKSFQIIINKGIIERKINLLRENFSEDLVDKIEKNIDDYIKSRM